MQWLPFENYHYYYYYYYYYYTVLTTACDVIENATVHKGTQETVSLSCAIVIGDSQPTINWIFNDERYDCGSSKNDVVNGRGCYTSDKATHFVVLDTGSLASGEYPVQCVIEQNIPLQFVNDVDFEETLNCTRLNMSVTVLELKSEETKSNNVLVWVVVGVGVAVVLTAVVVTFIAICVSTRKKR